MPLVEAESLLRETEPLLVPHDPEADRAALKRLALACAPFGPVVGVEKAEYPESILVETTGCESFFGGETALVQQALALLATEGYVARAGLADTIRQAWAASRLAGKGRMTCVPAGRGAAWLARQSIELLRLDERLLATLKSLGLHTIGALMKLPRAELPSRFGPDVLERLDQALGGRVETIEPLHAETPLAEDWSGEIPLADRREIETVLREQLESLASRLAPWEGITALRLSFGDDEPRMARPAAASRSAARLSVLLNFALERMPPPAEVTRIMLVAETARLPAPEPGLLFDSERSIRKAERAFRELAERLSGRLGATNVVRPVYRGDPRPERATGWRSALEVGPSESPTEDAVIAAASRPALLLSPPERVIVSSVYPEGPPFRIERKGRTVELVQVFGPERIEATWTDGPEVRRDYWRVETETAERLWLFHCRRSGDWFLHGLFA